MGSVSVNREETLIEPINTRVCLITSESSAVCFGGVVLEAN